jgi:acyl-CoA synthetase (AMP-forming)/AMP-acid ligase II
MSRAAVLGVKVPPVEERRRQIESEPLPANIGALLDEAAAAAPTHVAMNFFESGEALTYAELRARVNRLARGMAGLGIGKGTHVGVMMPNVAAMPITWLALARLGAVMVPMNIAYTPREVQYVVEDAEVTWLLIHEECLATLDATTVHGGKFDNGHVVVVGTPRAGQRVWAALLEGKDDSFQPKEAPGHDDLMNIQYTSGTTGFPKGCMLTQRYWLTIGKVNARRDGRAYERVLAATPFFYMDPQWLLLMAFYHRGTLFAARRQSASRFMEWVRAHRIQFCLFPEVVAQQPPSPKDRDNEIVRVNVYGMRKDIQAAVEERFDMIVREAFGMTEIGSGLFMPIEAADMVGSGSCGMPAPFREARIVDDEGRDVPEGEMGELVVRGPGILKGYYRKPEATRDAFFGEWFRTGDIFRKDARGFYYIVGRKKDMIRRAGENISAREVEAVLKALPGVADAAAVPVPDPTRGQEVKIYVVLAPPATKDQVPPERIIAHCEANLARFKVPRYIAYRDSLPKTPSEKIAKGELVNGVADLRAGSFDRVEGRWQ